MKIDRLPQEVRDEIERLRAQEGRTWEAIEQLSIKFAGHRLPARSLLRWWDIRVGQELARVAERAALAERVQREWAKIPMKHLPLAVRQKLGQMAFPLSATAEKGQEEKQAKLLVELGWLLAKHKQLDIAASKVEMERDKLNVVAQKARGLEKQLGKKKVSAKELRNTLREIYGLAEAKD